jgi:hypothetical protein
MVFALASLTACSAARPRSSQWLLVEPPATEETGAPAGVRIDPRAPLPEWKSVARFANATGCELERQERGRRAVERAQRERGDGARLDPALRRAVHARCVEQRRQLP